MKVFYFSGTGNSLYIAKSISGEIYSIPQVLKNKETYFEDDKIGIVFPTYSMSLPQIVLEFIKKVSLNSPYIFAIMTCGRTNGNSSKYFYDIAKKQGITIHYSTCISMVGNHLPLADLKDELVANKNVDEQLTQIQTDIATNQLYIYKGMFLGSGIRYAGKIANYLHPHNCKDFTVSESCIGCGTCSKVCPRNNITLSDNGPVFGTSCENCLSCLHNCPKKSIQIANDKNPSIRYRHKDVSLAEIINSNSQI